MFQASLTNKVHNRMLDGYGPEFFGGETPTGVVFDAILEQMVPTGVDRSMKVTALKRKKIS